MKRILIIEDESGLRIAMQDRLCAEGYETDGASDGATGLRKLKEESYDLALLDRMLPGKSGTELLREYRAAGGKKPVIMVTARSTLEDKVMGLTVGADDYVTKPFEFAELVARIEARLREIAALTAPDETGPEPVIMDLPDFCFGPFTLSYRRGVLEKEGQPVNLSLQEFKLLSYLTRHAGETVPNDTLLDRLWGYGESIGTRTVYTHVSWVRAKIKTPDRPDSFIRTVRGIGYTFTV